MRHLGDIAEDRGPGNVLAESDHQWVVRVRIATLGEKRTESDGGLGCVGHLDSDQRLAGDWCLDAHWVSSESEFEVGLEAQDLRELHAFGGFQGITGDTGADRDLIQLYHDAEVQQGSLDQVRIRLDVTHAWLAAVTLEK